MKRILVTLVIVLFLNGCSSDDSQLQRPMQLRERIIKASSGSFEMIVTADYGDKLHTFQLSCTADAHGNIQFTVTDPSAIAGISGNMNAAGGALTFDDQVLVFPPLADGQISPVSCPWLFWNTLRSGYIVSCGKDGDNLRVIIDDSYEENPVQLDFWLNNENVPIRSEILFKGKRILSMDVKNFTLQ